MAESLIQRELGQYDGLFGNVSLDMGAVAVAHAHEGLLLGAERLEPREPITSTTPGIYDIHANLVLHGMEREQAEALAAADPTRIRYIAPSIHGALSDLAWADFSAEQLQLAGHTLADLDVHERNALLMTRYVAPPLADALRTRLEELDLPYAYVRSVVVSAGDPIQQKVGTYGKDDLIQYVDDVSDVLRTGNSRGGPNGAITVFSRDELRYRQPPLPLHRLTIDDLARQAERTRWALRQFPDLAALVHPALLVIDPRQFHPGSGYEYPESLFEGARWEDVAMALFVLPSPVPPVERLRPAA